MNDVPISLEQAANWLMCSPNEVSEHLSAGRILPYSGKGADPDKPISLNSVVVLAESLPAERGVFHVREGAPDRPPPARGFGGERRGPGQRPAVIVERRPLRGSYEGG